MVRGHSQWLPALQGGGGGLEKAEAAGLVACTVTENSPHLPRVAGSPASVAPALSRASETVRVLAEPARGSGLRAPCGDKSALVLPERMFSTAPSTVGRESSAGSGLGTHWLPRHRRVAGKGPPRPRAGPPRPHARSCSGPHSPVRATVPSSRSARRGPRSRGGKTQQSPRRARPGRPRRAGASGQAGSGRGPRLSSSCCSGCACWWTAGSGSGSGCGQDGGDSVRDPGFYPGDQEAPALSRPLWPQEPDRPDVPRSR